jgi:hypothetical protein
MERMPSKPQLHEPKARPAPLLHAAGLALMAANKVRRTFRRYDRPRPWSARDVDRSVDYVLALYGNWGTGFRDAGIGEWLRGRNVLELGPGPDLGTGLILLAHGAESYVAVDRFPLLGSTPDAFYDTLLHRLSDAPDVWRAVAAYQSFRRGDPSGAMRYVLLDGPSGAAAAPEGPPRDLWISHAALEHVAEPRPLLAALSAWCAPSAIALHHVDAATHTQWLRDADPLNILRYGSGLYNALSFPGTPNRWRRGRYEECFRSVGWEVVDDQQIHRLSQTAIARVRGGLDAEFRDLPDDEIAVHSFRLVLRKRPGWETS